MGLAAPSGMSHSIVLTQQAVIAVSSLSVQCYAVHGQNINLPVYVCVSVCPSHFLSTRLQVRPLNGFLQLIA